MRPRIADSPWWSRWKVNSSLDSAIGWFSPHFCKPTHASEFRRNLQSNLADAAGIDFMTPVAFGAEVTTGRELRWMNAVDVVSF